MSDPCIVSSYSLSQREQMLKNKLYSVQKPKQTALTASSTAGRAVQCVKPTTEASAVTDQNLNDFVTELRQEIVKSQTATGGTGMTQNFMYHKAQMLESHIGLLEKNQQSLTELIKTVLESKNKQGGEEKIKYEICNENRRLLTEVMAPLHRQIADIKNLYEENKGATQEVYEKIENLKDIIKVKPYDVEQEIERKYQRYKSGSSKMNGAINNAYQVIDNLGAESISGISAEAYKTELAKIKEQMQAVQKDSQAIELEMQRRFARILEENERCKLLLAANIHQPTIARPEMGRDGIKQRLEEFDYDSFVDTIADYANEISVLEKKFKSGATSYPNITMQYGKNKAPPFYDFNVEPVQLKTRIEKPQHLANIKTRTVVVKPPVKEILRQDIDLSKNIVTDITTKKETLKKSEPVERKNVAKPRKEPASAPAPLPEKRKPKTPPKEPTPFQHQIRELSEPRGEANKIELKEYIDEQVRKQIREAMTPVKEKKVEKQVEIHPAVADIEIKPVVPKTEMILSENRALATKKMAEHELKGTVENMLADLLFKEIKASKRETRKEPIKTAEEEYPKDFEEESGISSPGQEKQLSGVLVDNLQGEEKKERSRSVISDIKEDTKQSHKELDKSIGVQVSKILKEVTEVAVDATPRMQEVPEKPLQEIPGRANTFVYIKRANEVQQIPQNTLSILPRPKKSPQPDEHVPIEHVKIDTEAEILKRRVPINVEPLIAGILEPPAQLPPIMSGAEYNNPFAVAGLQIPPPHIVNLEEYDISSTSYANSGQDSSISESERAKAHHLASNQKPYTESAAESESEGEVRLKPQLGGLSVEQSRQFAQNRASTPSSALSLGEIRIPEKRVGNIFSAEDYTYSEGEHKAAVDDASSRIFSEEEQSRVHELDEVENIGRIREIKKQQDVLKQSQESFGLRSSLKMESIPKSGTGQEGKLDIMFSADDSEPEEGEVRPNPFHIKK